MKTNKKVKSITIALNINCILKTFWRFLIMDILIICAVIAVFCIQSEINYYGSFVYNATRSVKGTVINDIIYCVTWENGRTMILQAGTFLNTVKFISIGALICQGIFIINEILFGRRKINKILRPLNEITEMASRLSNMNFGNSTTEELEDAISKISPVASGERLHTGNRELKGLEEAINNLLDRMRESYIQQARFVSDASHELRTPISVIQGYANMLDRWGKEDESVLDESIIAIKNESENMKILVEQLLFLARGINGKTQLKCNEFCLNDMMREVFEESKMIDEKHVYEYNSEGIITVYGDEALLKQTVRILIENAAKYTDEGNAIMLCTGINENREPYMWVQDNGIGMDSHDVCRIFDRFFRSDTARTRKTGGTGLGLSIAKWIVDNHGGYFSVLSRKGIGTRITVFLHER